MALKLAQKKLLLTGDEFERGSIGHVNNVLVNASDVTNDISYLANKTLQRLMEIQMDCDNCDIDPAILNDMAVAATKLQSANRGLDAELIKLNPHIDEVRV